ncbi:MAG: transpeptidase family protein [Spirochaetales bacterium]|nr:transpeptidase family protein [Spirochaetales bacterium]
MLEKRYLSRFVLFAIIIAVLLSLILWRYISLMLMPGADPAAVTARTPHIERGPILDRNGRILALQTQLDTVTAWMPNVKDPDRTAELLLSVLDADDEYVRNKFRSAKGFFFIKHTISKSESDAVRSLMENGSISGISLIPEPKRIYPQGESAAHLVGYAGKDNQGLLGIEYSYDKVLSPEKNEQGALVQFGNQVFLTIDIHLQFLLEQVAQTAFKTHNPDNITIIAADGTSGDVLAYVSVPGFNPNSFNESSPSARLNIPAVYAYEPGSVFKIFSVAAFMELAGIEPNSLFYCNGTYDHVDPAINCLGVHGWVTPADIIRESCNAGAAFASESIEAADFYRFLTSYGFGIRTGAPVPGETNGILNGLSDWTERTKPTIAFGQEISVSALQVVQAATVFTSGGELLELHLVDKIVSPDGEVITDNIRTPVRRVLSSSTAQAMLLMMETATETGGTAARAKIDGIRMSAKTGTAQVPDPKTRGYSNDNFVASTLAIFPTEQPRIILYVVIHHPRGTQKFGGRIAAPLVKEAGEEIIRFLGIPKEGDIILTHSGRITLPALRPIRVGEKMLDLQGLSKRQLFPLITEERLNVYISGTGWVVRQTPEPGTVLQEGQDIHLYLE